VPGALADTATVLLMLGNMDVIQARFDRAANREAVALEQFQRAGNDWGVGEALSALGAIFYCTGNYKRAAAYYAEGLRCIRRLGHPLMVASELTGLAGVAAAIGQSEKGACLLGAAEAIRGSLDAPMAPRDQPVLARVIAALTAALGSERLSAAREAGRALNPEAAVAAAEAIAKAAAQKEWRDGPQEACDSSAPAGDLK
jgi:tetratricopeptide (TPR) repeat protein